MWEGEQGCGLRNWNGAFYRIRRRRHEMSRMEGAGGMGIGRIINYSRDQIICVWGICKCQSELGHNLDRVGVIWASLLGFLLSLPYRTSLGRRKVIGPMNYKCFYTSCLRLCPIRRHFIGQTWTLSPKMCVCVCGGLAKSSNGIQLNWEIMVQWYH